MLSRKDLNSAELETVKVSHNLTTVVTAIGEVHTKEEATVYVRELGLFVRTSRIFFFLNWRQRERMGKPVD